MSAFGGKADMTFCVANVRLPKTDIQLVPNGLFLGDRADIVLRDTISSFSASYLREGTQWIGVLAWVCLRWRCGDWPCCRAMPCNDSNALLATTFPVPKDRAAIRAGLLLREINPDRDRNENCSGYNQSTEDIFHLVRPLQRAIETLSEATVFILGRGRPWADRLDRRAFAWFND
jgi:hypothetical protein